MPIPRENFFIVSPVSANCVIKKIEHSKGINLWRILLPVNLRGKGGIMYYLNCKKLFSLRRYSESEI